MYRSIQQGMKTLLLLGIKATMQSSVYQDVCGKHTITVIVPSPDQQDDIEKIIFEELVVGVIREESRKTICDIITEYNVDGVILGCTELPLLVRQKDVDKGLLNTGEIHVEAALDYALV